MKKSIINCTHSQMNQYVEIRTRPSAFTLEMICKINEDTTVNDNIMKLIKPSVV